jgi:hypothetical protein
LEEIYHSSIGDKPLWAPRPEGPREWLVTNHSAEYFFRLTHETEAAVLGMLAGRALADSLDEPRSIERADFTSITPDRPTGLSLEPSKFEGPDGRSTSACRLGVRSGKAR